jgi:ferredoxin-like protein FixX
MRSQQSSLLSHTKAAARCCHRFACLPGFRAGLWGGIAHAAVDTYLLRGAAPWTLRHGAPDHASLAPAAASRRIAYPPPDNALTFDLPTSLARSGTDHEHDQPPHLRVADATVAERINRDVYDGPEGRYCPAGVYEWVTPPDGDATGAKLIINAQNCLHCVRARAVCVRAVCAAMRILHADGADSCCCCVCALCSAEGVRREGPGAEHQVDAAGGRRRPWLHADVKSRAAAAFCLLSGLIMTHALQNAPADDNR